MNCYVRYVSMWCELLPHRNIAHIDSSLKVVKIHKRIFKTCLFNFKSSLDHIKKSGVFELSFEKHLAIGFDMLDQSFMIYIMKNGKIYLIGK